MGFANLVQPGGLVGAVSDAGSPSDLRAPRRGPEGTKQ